MTKRRNQRRQQALAWFRRLPMTDRYLVPESVVYYYHGDGTPMFRAQRGRTRMNPHPNVLLRRP